MVLFFVLAAISGLAVGAVDAFVLKRGKTKFGTAMVLISDVIGLNVFSVYLIEFIVFYYTNKGVLSLQNDFPYIPWIQAAAVLVTGLVWLLIMGLVDGKIRFAKVEEKPTKKQKKMTVASLILFSIGMVAVFATFWSVSTFSSIAPDQLLVNMVSPKEATSEDVMNTVWTVGVLRAGAFIFAFFLFALSKREVYFKRTDKERRFFTVKVRRIISFVMAVVSLVGGLIYGITAFNLIDLYKFYIKDSTFIEDNYVDPNEVKMQFPETKRNLIHIYLESMENSYLSKDMGGYLDENLMKPLTDLAQEGVVFSNSDLYFGGPISTTGCVWSVASMVNMTTGLTMKPPVAADNYGSPETFLPGAVSIGDILASQGYEQSLMFGAAARFGGLDYYFTTHGNFNILDFYGVKKLGWIPQNYRVRWGYEDDKLFEFAKREITRLNSTGKPFHFVMETADTHFPDGYVGPNTPTPRPNQYSNVIAYSASEVAKFVRWIQEQPFYENTTIVIIGDHLSMDKNYFKNFDEDYLRTTFNVIINPANDLVNIPVERKRNRTWCNIDMFPTILASMGVKIEGDRLALGTNLFSGEPTLMERNGEGMEGWEYVDEQLKYKSDLYNDVILQGVHKPFDPKNITTY